ncbi:MAG TPA: hydroxyisourate hydrolase [Casimicrobiaceae bacterium]|nr:hydroxyisourate hydrolase [Casimicrobiaceae bacterium]
MKLDYTSRRTFLATGAALGASAVLSQRAAAQAAQPATSTPAVPGRLTFHGIDTWNGATIGTLRVDIAMLDGAQYRSIKSFDTATNGRSDGALFEGPTFKPGRYELTMHVADYYAALSTKLPSPPFLTLVPLRFNIADANQRYHIAVLFGPWSYAYYRGS